MSQLDAMRFGFKSASSPDRDYSRCYVAVFIDIPLSGSQLLADYAEIDEDSRHAFRAMERDILSRLSSTCFVIDFVTARDSIYRPLLSSASFVQKD